jgi:hypothetical protein
MRTSIFALLVTTLGMLAAAPARAHHSFAVYDMKQNVEFKGVVDTLKFRNPHTALTLIVTQPDGTKETIDFVETAPANMLVRMGLTPQMVAHGTAITAIGAPRFDNPKALFLKAVVLGDGTRFQIMN